MTETALAYLLSNAGQPRDLVVKLARLYQRDRWRFSPCCFDRLAELGYPSVRVEITESARP